MTAEKGHEERDVRVGALFTIAFSVFVCCAGCFLVVSAMWRYFSLHDPAKTGERANIPLTAVENFPQPRLQVQSGGDLQKLRAAEEADLNSYGWVNRDATIVRVPIDRAMQLLMQRGLPDVGAGQTPLSLMQARPSETASPPRLKPSSRR